MIPEIERFLDADVFAVAGASANPTKYGNRIFKMLHASGRVTYPLNPARAPLDEVLAYSNLEELPEIPQSVSIVTPPEATFSIVHDAIRIGVKHLWMQPGAEHLGASQLARAAGIDVIDDGSCILVFLARG